MESFFALENISKSYGTLDVLRGISLTFSPGERTLLLGANGAGKSTLLKICAGLMRADCGAVTGISHGTHPAQIGYMGHAPLLYGDLTVRENLVLWATMLSLPTSAVEESLHAWELLAHGNKRIDDLSKGLTARASLARAFLSRPKYLFLDEPTSALDERSLGLLNNNIDALAQHHSGNLTLVIATHDIARVLPRATRVVVIQEGTVADDTNTLSEQFASLPLEMRTAKVVSEYISTNR